MNTLPALSYSIPRPPFHWFRLFCYIYIYIYIYISAGPLVGHPAVRRITVTVTCIHCCSPPLMVPRRTRIPQNSLKKTWAGGADEPGKACIRVGSRQLNRGSEIDSSFRWLPSRGSGSRLASLGPSASFRSAGPLPSAAANRASHGEASLRSA